MRTLAYFDKLKLERFNSLKTKHLQRVFDAVTKIWQDSCGNLDLKPVRKLFLTDEDGTGSGVGDGY